ncbi:hypothetical protein [Streptomyces sp. NPDC101455]|uniref:hypothetical protein n=1 Tax=Streptomyces sp. NPDC101455 TaxID=3366142 RepID=UPI0037F52E56
MNWIWKASASLVSIERADVCPPRPRGRVELGDGAQQLPLLLKSGRIFGSCGGGDVQRPLRRIGVGGRRQPTDAA